MISFEDEMDIHEQCVKYHSDNSKKIFKEVDMSINKFHDMQIGIEKSLLAFKQAHKTQLYKQQNKAARNL